MSTAQEARQLADALRAEYLDGVLSAKTLPSAAAMLRAQAEQIERLQAERNALASDLEDWHKNAPDERQQVAADVITMLRRSEALAWEGVDVMARDLDRVTAERDSLRAALQAFVKYAEECDDDSIELDRARAALAAKEQSNG